MNDQRNHEMVHFRDYVAGWLDSSIHDFLEFLPRTSSSISYALITCLDSHWDSSSLLHKSPALKPLARVAKLLKRGFLLPTDLLLQADFSNQIFFGFDEVWFFPSDRIDPKPDGASLVGPKRIDQRKLDKLVPWMIENGCSMALGDGDGLNVIVKARGLVKYLIASSLSQPEPTLQMNEP